MVRFLSAGSSCGGTVGSNSVVHGDEECFGALSGDLQRR